MVDITRDTENMSIASKNTADVENMSIGSLNTLDIKNMNLGDLFWNNSQRMLLQSHREYHREMILCIDYLEENGPSEITLPVKPKPDLKNLLGDTSTSKKLFGLELHKYLEQHLVPDLKPEYCQKLPETQGVDSLEKVKDYLVKGYMLLQKSSAAAISSSLNYGNWLDHAFRLHQLEYWGGHQVDTWSVWLKANIGISDSYARKLRDMSKIVNNYTKFHLINLQFSELYKHRKQIEHMLSDPNIANLWL